MRDPHQELQTIPRRLSWGFRLLADDQEVADVDFSRWREKGTMAAGGKTYDLYREGRMSGKFLLEAGGSILARAEKPGILSSTFHLDIGGRAYELRRKGIFSRVFVLWHGSSEVGAVMPQRLFSRRMRVDLPAEIELPAKAFVAWLVMLMWRRAANSG